MKYKFTICVITFSFILFLFPNYILVNRVSHAQIQEEKKSGVAKLFDQAAAKNKRELYNLWGLRSAPSIYLSDVSSQSIAGVLSVKSRRENYYLNEATYLEKTAVLFYSYENEVLQVWLVNEYGIQAYHKRKISENQINEAITNLRNSLGVDSLALTRSPHRRGIIVSRTEKPTYLPVNSAVSKITDILLPPPITNKLASVRHLIIVAVLGLSTVPYGVLQPFKDNSFLIEKMSISIAPSLFDVGQTIESRWNANAAFSSPLIVGNPYLPPSSEWVVPPLPGAEKEAQAVASKINTTPLIEKQATKENILLKSNNASLLYFATHGVASSSNPLSGSFLMLSSDKLEQGWWTAKQIQEAKFRTVQITVLSACQTGLGKVHDAGIIGLARAFQIAGVPRVVMSLWSVDDVATSELMQAFVKYLKNNIPSEALRKAMLEVRKQHPNPSEWASFVLFGTPR